MPSAAPSLFKTVAPDDPLKFWKGRVLDYDRIRDFTNLDTQDVARITGLKKSSIRYDERAPAEVQEHFAKIANICNLVFGFFDSDTKTKLWFTTPNPMLGNITPREMIRSGRYAKLLRFITDAMEDEAAADEPARKSKKP